MRRRHERYTTAAAGRYRGICTRKSEISAGQDRTRNVEFNGWTRPIDADPIVPGIERQHLTVRPVRKPVIPGPAKLQRNPNTRRHVGGSIEIRFNARGRVDRVSRHRQGAGATTR